MISLTTGASSICAWVAASSSSSSTTSTSFAQLLHVLEERLQLLVGRLVVLLDQVAERVLAGDDREEVVPGDELEVVEDAGVGGIGHRHRQRAALALERQHDVLQGELAGIILRILGSTSKRDRSTAGIRYCRADDLGDLEFLDQPELHQDVAQPVPGGLLLRQGRRQLLARDQPFANQDIAQPIIAGSSCRHRPGGFWIVMNDNGLRRLLP